MVYLEQGTGLGDYLDVDDGRDNIPNILRLYTHKIIKIIIQPFSIAFWGLRPANLQIYPQTYKSRTNTSPLHKLGYLLGGFIGFPFTPETWPTSSFSSPPCSLPLLLDR